MRGSRGRAWLLTQLLTDLGKDLGAQKLDAPAEGVLQALRRSPKADPSIQLINLGQPTYPDADHPTRPVDEAFFGSPLLLDQGAVGMVVAEKTVITLNTISSLRTTSR